MVKAGEDVRIIDKDTQADLTSVTLTQIIHEQEKSARSMPLGVLRGIIQTSGTLNELIDRSVASASSSVTEFRQGALTFREAVARQLVELSESARRYFSKEERRAEEFRRSAWESVDELERMVEERVREVQATRAVLEQHVETRDGLGVDEVLERNTRCLEHVHALRTRVAALSVLIDRLERAAREPLPPENEL